MDPSPSTADNKSTMIKQYNNVEVRSPQINFNHLLECPFGFEFDPTLMKCKESFQEKTLASNLVSMTRRYLQSTCATGQYFNSTQLSCVSCPTGCASCINSTNCTTCSLTAMSVSKTDGLCYCPVSQYFSTAQSQCFSQLTSIYSQLYSIDCQSKCQLCSNEYSCQTYKTCQNPFQYLQSNGTCTFACQTGYHISTTTCGTCADSNCLQCAKAGTQCGRCNTGYYLDLTTYTCVSTCPTLSLPISTTNTHDLQGTTISYCRPYNQTINNFTYYVNPISTSQFELGTYEHPFKNFDSPAKEILNFMYLKATNVTVYIQRGTTLSHYYGLMPIVLLNLRLYSMMDYGDQSLAKPYVYIRDNPYQWPDSTLFSLAELFYDYKTRVTRGDMSQTEASTYFLKVCLVRASVNITNIDFQAIMYGDAWSNPLIYTIDAYNESATVSGSYLDLDGALMEAYLPVAFHLTNSIINITNYQYGIWLDFRWNCYALGETDIMAWLVVENTQFQGTFLKALYNFVFLGSMDDYIFRNNTFSNFVYLNVATRPFLDMHPDSVCDPAYRTQNIVHDNNKFINMTNSNVIFNINYMGSYNGTKTFTMRNNYYENCIINTQLLMLQISQTMAVTVSNNTYKNVSIINGNAIFYFFSELTNLPITNEKATGCTLDDLYIIGAVNNLNITNFQVSNTINTGAITETSAIVSVSQANGLITISNYVVKDSVFLYGKALEIQAAYMIDIRDSYYTNNSLSSQDFIQLNYIQSGVVKNLTYTNFVKNSDQARYALSFSSLQLVNGLSTYLISNLSFTNSATSFIEIAQAQPLVTTDTSNYIVTINNCYIYNNTLTSKDSLLEFGEINYLNFQILLSNITVQSNTLELGTIYSLLLNCKMLEIKNSLVQFNKGQFASLIPSSSDTSNPLRFYIDNTTFVQNYATSDALIQLTTNSIMTVTLSNFTENYSIGRGSIVFADYQSVYALFQNCTIVRNYAYQGGAFYIQYSSVLEVQNSMITQNFGVIGGVAYVNNDGLIKINSGSKVFKNSAINTCFLFLINTQYVSVIDNITITQNDQANALINKNLFLSLNSSIMHIQYTFIQGMQNISSKVQRTVNEKTDSAVYSIKANVNFSNSFIYNNDAFLSASTQSTVGFSNTNISNIIATGSIIQLVSSTISLSMVTMTNISYIAAASGTAFYKISVVNKSKFYGSALQMIQFVGPMFYVSGSTFVLSSNSLMSNCRNDDKSSPLLSFDTSVVNITDSNLYQLYSEIYSPIINLQTNTLYSQNLTIAQFDKGLFDISYGTYSFDGLNVSQSQMQWSVGDQIFQLKSVIMNVATANVTITNSLIKDITSLYTSPAIYIYNDPSASASLFLSLTNSTFKNNSALQTGGAIESVNTNVTVSNCTFWNNYASQEGGALYLSCSDSATFPCTYNITSSNFTNNSAKINGGAIKYDFYSPILSGNNTFKNNTASYGPDLASYPTQLVIISSNMTQLTNSQISTLGLTNAIAFKLSNDLVSGSIMSQNVSFKLLDEKGNIITTDSTSQISLSAVSTLSSQVQVMQTKTVTAVNGSFIFNDAIVIGPPGTNIILQVTSDSIDSSKITKAFPWLGVVPDIYLQAYLRLCIRGEYQSSDNKCLTCQDGFYTLVGNLSSCAECPEHSQCQDGDNITVDEGYWRQSINSTDIIACYNTDACPSNSNISCAVGYGGNLCQSCIQDGDLWYFQEGSSVCSACLSHTKNTLRIFGVALLVAAYIVLLVIMNVRNAGKQKFSTVYMRILTNYFQILTLTQSFDLSWGDNLKTFLQTISFIAEGSTILLSVDCLVRDANLPIEPIFVKMILACLFLIGAILIAIITWVILGFFMKHLQVRRNIIISIIILIFIFLPSISNITLAIYNCLDIFGDGTSYLALDMSIQCWSGSQNKYAYNYGIPIIVIWIIGFPLVAFIILFRNRKNLYNHEFYATYGFIYIGLSDHAYYWEILLHFRKILIISINVFFTTFVSLYRALIGFMLMIVYIEFLQKVKPYRTKEMNDLELKSNIAAFATFYGGLFFISDGIPVAVSIIIFLVILVINLIFWLSWLKCMFKPQYLKLEVCFMKRCCTKRYQAQKKALYEKKIQQELAADAEFDHQQKGKGQLEDSQRDPEQDSQRFFFQQQKGDATEQKKAKKEKRTKKKSSRQRLEEVHVDNNSEDEESHGKISEKKKKSSKRPVAGSVNKSKKRPLKTRDQDVSGDLSDSSPVTKFGGESAMKFVSPNIRARSTMQDDKARYNKNNRHDDEQSIDQITPQPEFYTKDGKRISPKKISDDGESKVSDSSDESGGHEKSSVTKTEQMSKSQKQKSQYSTKQNQSQMGKSTKIKDMEEDDSQEDSSSESEKRNKNKKSQQQYKKAKQSIPIKEETESVSNSSEDEAEQKNQKKQRKQQEEKNQQRIIKTIQEENSDISQTDRKEVKEKKKKKAKKPAKKQKDAEAFSSEY